MTSYSSPAFAGEGRGVAPTGRFFRSPLLSRRMRLPRTAVIEELDQQVRQALQRPRRSRIVPIALIIFAIGASACAYLWVNYGDQLRTPAFTSPAAIDSQVATSAERTVSHADLDTFKRQTAVSFQSAAENLEAQKRELRRLSNQVADLAAKVDALRNAVATVPASPQMQKSISAPLVGQPTSAAVAERKKPRAPKAGPISVGGAPLPPAPNR